MTAVLTFTANGTVAADRPPRSRIDLSERFEQQVSPPPAAAPDAAGGGGGSSNLIRTSSNNSNKSDRSDGALSDGSAGSPRSRKVRAGSRICKLLSTLLPVLLVLPFIPVVVWLLRISMVCQDLEEYSRSHYSAYQRWLEAYMGGMIIKGAVHAPTFTCPISLGWISTSYLGGWSYTSFCKDSHNL